MVGMRSEFSFFVNSSSWPISINEWNKFYSDVHCNCLAFAFGLPVNDPCERIFSDLCSISRITQRNSIPLAIKADCDMLGLECVELDDPNVVCDCHVFAVWGFYVYTIGDFTYYDFHIARKELDGTWVHKPGWYKHPEVTTLEEIILDYDGDIPHYFAIKKKSS